MSYIKSCEKTDEQSGVKPTVMVSECRCRAKQNLLEFIKSVDFVSKLDNEYKRL